MTLENTVTIIWQERVQSVKYLTKHAWLSNRSKAESVTRVLVLVPTRELGVQVFQVSKQLCQFTSIDVALSVGGLDLRLQEAALRKNPDIVIATPGRLIDHIKNTPTFGLENIEVLILDEADRLPSWLYFLHLF